MRAFFTRVNMYARAGCLYASHSQMIKHPCATKKKECDLTYRNSSPSHPVITVITHETTTSMN